MFWKWKPTYNYRENTMSDIKIVIPKDEIIETIERKIVSPNGQISLGKKHAGKTVTVYVVEG